MERFGATRSPHDHLIIAAEDHGGHPVYDSDTEGGPARIAEREAAARINPLDPIVDALAKRFNQLRDKLRAELAEQRATDQKTILKATGVVIGEQAREVDERLGSKKLPLLDAIAEVIGKRTGELRKALGDFVKKDAWDFLVTQIEKLSQRVSNLEERVTALEPVVDGDAPGDAPDSGPGSSTGAPGAPTDAVEISFGRVRGLHDPDAVYRAGDLVAFNGAEWRAVHHDPGVLPGSGWRLAASRGKSGKTGPRGTPGVGIAKVAVEDTELVVSLSDGTKTRLDLLPAVRKILASNARIG